MDLLKLTNNNSENYFVTVSLGGIFMYQYSFWPGAYSFNNEISLFLLAIKDEIDKLLKKIEC